jgi:hypothetical protein
MMIPIDALVDRAILEECKSASIKVLEVMTDPNCSLPASVTFGLGEDIERVLTLAAGRVTTIAAYSPKQANTIAMQLVQVATSGAASGSVGDGQELVLHAWVVNATSLALPSHAQFGKLRRRSDRVTGCTFAAAWTVDVEFDVEPV